MTEQQSSHIPFAEWIKRLPLDLKAAVNEAIQEAAYKKWLDSGRSASTFEEALNDRQSAEAEEMEKYPF